MALLAITRHSTQQTLLLTVVEQGITPPTPMSVVVVVVVAVTTELAEVEEKHKQVRLGILEHTGLVMTAVLVVDMLLRVTLAEVAVVLGQQEAMQPLVHREVMGAPARIIYIEQGVI
jgi:hypothetical protein